MKKSVSVILLLFVSSMSYGQCDTYFNFTEGAEYEMTHYNKKDKKSGKTLTRIVSVREEGGETVATVQGIAYDKKEEEITRMEYEYRCDEGVLKVDLSRMIPRESLEQNPDVRFELSGDFITFPPDLEKGQKLDDGTITGKMIMGEAGPAAAMNMTLEVKNRRVMDTEEITTPLGTYSCFKITYDVSSTTKMMGMNITNESSGVEFLAKDIGIIKTESYNKKGKLTGYSVLTDYSE